MRVVVDCKKNLRALSCSVEGIFRDNASYIDEVFLKKSFLFFSELSIYKSWDSKYIELCNLKNIVKISTIFLYD